MLFTIAVDANPILAALLGGYARTILFDPRFCFITTEFTIVEVRRYPGRVSAVDQRQRFYESRPSH